MSKLKNKTKPVKITAEEFDRRFDAGEDMSPYLDKSKAKMVYPETHRVNVDFPEWTVRALDHEATRRGMTRQALIKFWIVEKLDNAKAA